MKAKTGSVIILTLVTVFILSSCSQLASNTVTTPMQSARTLEENKVLMRDVLNLPGVVYLDANEACDCINVGIASPAQITSVENFAMQMAVPLAKVKTVITRPYILYASLRDNIRPTKGGMQIMMGPTAACTQTASVFSRALNKKGLLTCSHCTDTQGGTESTNFFQPDMGFLALNHVGLEKIDPPLTNSLPECPGGRVCRRSDAAFAEFDQSTQGAVGKLARPKSMCGPLQCNIDMDNLNDELSIINIGGTPHVGEFRGKIGRTSGWSQSRVTNTCVDVNVKDTNITLICQHFVAAFSAPGDSGAPVFELLQNNKVVLDGILWGGPDDHSSFAYSSVTDIETELGGIDFF